MAANYWSSTQYHFWTFKKQELAEIRRRLEDADRQLVSQFPLPERRLLNIYFSLQLAKLGKRMSIRQQPLATAQVYMRRYYTKVEIRRTNPYLVMSTAFYLACKTEECPQHIRLVVGEARQFWSDFLSSDTSQLGECEFSLISEMSSQLIVHHPYRSLQDITSMLGLTLDESTLAWSIINDHYLTDLPLLYAPHVIAVTAAVLAVVLKPPQQSGATANIYNTGGMPALQGGAGMANAVAGALASGGGGNTPNARVQKLINWLADSQVDIASVIDCVQELISLYEVWDGYKEISVREPIARFVKARGLDK